MDLQLFAERLLWCSAVGTAAITVILSFIFVFDIYREGLAVASAPDRRRLHTGTAR